MQVLITCLASADSTAWARPQRRAGHGSRRGSTAAALQTPRPRVAALTATGAAATSSTTSEMSQRDPLDKIVRDDPVGGRLGTAIRWAEATYRRIGHVSGGGQRIDGSMSE